MLTRYGSVKEAETRKKYRQIGYDACKHGVDRKVADDFSVEYRPYIRQGWDDANTQSLFALLNIGSPDRPKTRRKFSE